MRALNKFIQLDITEPSTAFDDNSSHSDNLDALSETTWQYSNSENSELTGSTSPKHYYSDEYNGEKEPIASSSFMDGFPKIPWSRAQEYPETIEGLHYELIECYNWLKPTDQERYVRINVCNRVKNVLNMIWPDAILSVFGSVATNLFLPSSDIDVSVEYPSLSPYDMQVIAAAFRNSDLFINVTVLDRAYVPIIKLSDRETGIHIDISFNTQRAHKAVEYIMFIKYYYPALDLLALVFKQFLADKQLNQAFTGGLSSYGLVLMIVHYLLRFYQYEFYGKQLTELRPGVLGEFFMKFLKYYGSDFDPLNDALAFPQPVEGILLPKHELTAIMGEPMFNSILCIQDPLQPTNDVGRSSHNFMQIRNCFMSALKKLETVLMQGIFNGKRRIFSKEPMLHLILPFPQAFQQQRQNIVEMPFKAIEFDPATFKPSYENGYNPSYDMLAMPPCQMMVAPALQMVYPMAPNVIVPMYIPYVPQHTGESEGTATPSSSEVESQSETIIQENTEDEGIVSSTSVSREEPQRLDDENKDHQQTAVSSTMYAEPPLRPIMPGFMPFVPVHYPPMPLVYLPEELKTHQIRPEPRYRTNESDDDIDDAVRRLTIGSSGSSTGPKSSSSSRGDESDSSLGSFTGCSTVSPDCEDTVNNSMSDSLESDA